MNKTRVKKETCVVTGSPCTYDGNTDKCRMCGTMIEFYTDEDVLTEAKEELSKEMEQIVNELIKEKDMVGNAEDIESVQKHTEHIRNVLIKRLMNLQRIENEIDYEVSIKEEYPEEE